MAQWLIADISLLDVHAHLWILLGAISCRPINILLIADRRRQLI
jgi:hypothetical protein